MKGDEWGSKDLYKTKRGFIELGQCPPLNLKI